MQLYYNPYSRAVTAKWMLDECGIDYALVNIDFSKRDHKQPAFLQINPSGKLPVLVDGHTRLFECAAICMYLAERFPQKRLAPPVGADDRGRYLSLMAYSTSQLEPAMGDAFMKVTPTAAREWTGFREAVHVVERELGFGPWLLGAQFSAADVMIGSAFIWQKLFGGHSGSHKIDAYIQRLQARPAAMKIGTTASHKTS
ncbi:glutathione S-transferase family protein [Variovorax rhizosphaerae]|uniref:Glutathione S-transferase family protein n=1 Tax=Variovorax rhizosphaerae TaxID=1836200 RepID=A0ABU8WX10_9BURK